MVGVPQHVHGIVDVGRGRQALLELLRGGLFQGPDGQAVAHRGIGGHDAQAAGIGDDGRPVTLGQRLHGKGHGIVEQFLQGFHPKDAALGKEGVVGGIGAGQGAGMGGGGPGPRRGAAGLDGQDGLLPAPRGGDLLGQGKEAVRVGQILQVQQDDIRGGIVFEISQKVVFIEIGLVAHGHELGQADLFILDILQGGHTHRAALGDEGDVARLRHQPGKGGVQGHLGMGIDDAQAIGAQ
jgi:hypothetical protein